MRDEAKTWWLFSGPDVASSYFFKRKSVSHLNHEPSFGYRCYRQRLLTNYKFTITLCTIIDKGSLHQFDCTVFDFCPCITVPCPPEGCPDGTPAGSTGKNTEGKVDIFTFHSNKRTHPTMWPTPTHTNTVIRMIKQIWLKISTFKRHFFFLNRFKQTFGSRWKFNLTFNFQHVVHVFIRRNPMMCYRLNSTVWLNFPLVLEACLNVFRCFLPALTN